MPCTDKSATACFSYLFAFVYVGADMPLYSISLAMPTIVKNLGFETTTQANLVGLQGRRLLQLCLLMFLGRSLYPYTYGHVS